MDRPERTQAAGDASRRQGTAGAAPEPGQAAFCGRQVAGVPAAGPSPSRTQPQATRATAGVSESPGGPVFGEAGRAGRRFQPYSSGETGGRPGASLLPVVEPSVPPVPQEPGQEPERRHGWKTDYKGIEVRARTAAERGDTYAAAALASALHEIGQAVMEAHSRHLKIPQKNPPKSTMDALQRLRHLRRYAGRPAIRSRSEANQSRSEAIHRSLDHIYQLTRAKSAELDLRSDEFQAASPSPAVPVPDPESLGRWLQAQAEAAHDTDMEKPYFAHLARELQRGRDPWTVSREFIGSQPSTGNGQQAERLQEAHGRLVRAIARGLSERPSEPGVRAPPGDFNWRTAYDAIRRFCERRTIERDNFAADASSSALREIDGAIIEAHYRHRARPWVAPPYSALDAMHSLRKAMRGSAHRPRAEAIRKTLGDIDLLIHARVTELKLRQNEFRSASLPYAVPAPDGEALGRWLQSQADAVPGADIERSYFTHLALELSGGRDPWTVSQEFMRSLPSTGDPEQRQRLQAAHRRIVEAMAGSLPLQATVPAPVVAQVSHGSWAPTSMQQEIVGRLNCRRPLTNSQVRAIMSAVARAVASGSLPASTIQPESWARGLVDRVQASVLRPIGALTESERVLESSDLKRLVELLETLGGLGYL